MKLASSSSVVAPLGGHSLLVFLLELGVLLLAALSLGKLATRLKLPAIVGELCAGVLLGPSVFHPLVPRLSNWLLPTAAGQFHLLDAVGELGVIFLMGVMGTYFDSGLIRSRKRVVLTVSGWCLLLPLGLGLLTGFAVRGLAEPGKSHVVFILFIGIVMSVTALPVIAKTLADMNLLHRDIGQLTLAAGVLNDTFGWFMLSLVSALAVSGLGSVTVLRSAGYLITVVVVALLIGRPVVRWSFGRMNRSGEGAPVVTVSVILMLLCAAGTQALGLEAPLGAFICGILIGEYGKPDRAGLRPLELSVQTVLAPIFFATAGLRMNLTLLVRPAVFVPAALILVGAASGKFAGARTSRLTNWEALALRGHELPGSGRGDRGLDRRPDRGSHPRHLYRRGFCRHRERRSWPCRCCARPCGGWRPPRRRQPGAWPTQATPRPRVSRTWPEGGRAG
jgi:Kef-type K+ transport system membrane component KefB